VRLACRASEVSSSDGVDSVSGSEDSISQWQVLDLDLSGCEWGEDAEFPGEEPHYPTIAAYSKRLNEARQYS
jgi:hypothetical protein